MAKVQSTTMATRRYNSAPDSDDVEIVFGDDNSPNYRTLYNFDPIKLGSDDDVAEFFDDDTIDVVDDEENPNRIYFDAKKAAVLNEGVHEIPGSPWAKPASRPSSRPTEPLPIAKHASALALAITLGWCIFIFVNAIWNYGSVGRIIVEIFLGKNHFLFFFFFKVIKMYVPD